MTALARRWQHTAAELHHALEHGRIADTRTWRAAKESCAHLLRIAERRVPALAAHLATVCPDGYPGGGEGGSGELTATEAAVVARGGYAADHVKAEKLMIRIEQVAGFSRTEHLWAPQAARDHLDDLLGICDRYERPAPGDTASMRCTGGAGEPGCLEWGRPECDNIAARDRKGMCDGCYMRAYRWSKKRQEVA